MIRVRSLIVVGVVVILGASLGTAVARGQDAAPKTVWDGVYTEAQAERGATRYADNCAMCHGENMAGGPGVPGLAGIEFLFSYNNQTAGALFDYMKMNMPPGQQGTLTDQQYADLVAATFKGNGFPAGAAELPADMQALNQVRILRAKP